LAVFSRNHKNISLNYRIKENQELEVVVHCLTRLIKEAAWKATPPPRSQNIPLHIRELVAEKSRTRRRWQRTRNPLDKIYLNRLTHQLRTPIQSARNDTFRDYITNLSHEDQSLWKATKKIKRPTIGTPPSRTPDRTWVKTDQENVNIFAEHLAKVYSPAENDNIDRAEILNFLDVPCQLSLPTRLLSPNEVHQEVLKTNFHKAPRFELIVGDILKHLPKKAMYSLRYTLQ
jgi:hypothetical protein